MQANQLVPALIPVPFQYLAVTRIAYNDVAVALAHPIDSTPDQCVLRARFVASREDRATRY